MELVYTLISGTLNVKDKCFNLPFALVFEENGVYFIETFLSDEDFISEELLHNYFALIGKTKKGYDIEVTGLSLLRYEERNQRIEFECEHYIKLTDNRKEYQESEFDRIYGSRLWFLELEGLNMTFANYSEVIKYVAHEKKEINKFDHTSCSLHLDLDTENPGNHIHMIFSKNPANNNILIDFTKQKGYSYLSFDYYKKIKNELIHLISFINGADVSIKRELTGKSYRSDASNAQITYIYSFRKITNSSYCDFVPINRHHSYSKGIFWDIFLNCTKKYLNLNVNLDLNAFIVSLNNSYKANSLEDRIFILITAFEKIANSYYKMNDEQKNSILDVAFFDDELKPALIEILEKYRKRINKQSTYYNLKSRLGGINNGKYETTKKLFDFLDYSNIPINEKVADIIELRNKVVHEGFIGSTEEEKLNNYMVFDNILRDCLLNIIGYSCYRNRSIKYFSKSEMMHKEPTPNTVY